MTHLKHFPQAFPLMKDNLLVMPITASLIVSVLSLCSKRPGETMLLNTVFYECYTIKTHWIDVSARKFRLNVGYASLMNRVLNFYCLIG